MDNKKKTLFIGGAVAAAVLIIVIILCFVLSGSGRKYQEHYDKAELAFLQGDYDEAIESLEKAMDIELTEECYLLMAECYHAEGDTDMAVQVLYLGFSRVGGEAIEKRLEELKGESPDDDDEGGKPLGDDENEGDKIVIGGKTIDPDVKSLLLADKGLTDSDIAPLAQLTELESLSISGNSVIDISPLSGLTKLNVLQISDNKVKDLSPISGLSGLKTLYLDNNPVTDFSPLYKLGALRTLSMKGVAITEEQLDQLQEALPECSIFTDIEDDGVEDLSLGGKNFRSDVEELDLRGLGITDISVLAKCTELKKLDLRDNAIADISPLIDLQKLEWLCLWNNQVEDIRPLMTLTALKHLDLDNNKVKDISTVEYMTGIEALWLSGNPLDKIDVLERLPNLRRLGLKDTGLTDADLDILKKLTALTELTLENNPELTANKFAELEAALTQCEISHSELLYTVKYGDTEYKSDATSISAPGLGITDISTLEHFTSLRTLILSGNTISDISALAKCAELEVLDLYGNTISDISALSGLTKLRSLSLLDNNITSAAALTNLTALTELHLSYNLIADISPLANLTKLTDLDLDGNGIKNISALSGLTALSNLSLEDNDITDLTPLYGMSALKTLYIRDNDKLSADEVRALQEALPNCIITTDLDLSQSEELPPVENDPFAGMPPQEENGGGEVEE